MDRIERKLAVAVLKLAGEEFSNHGCEDFDLFEYMTPEEAMVFQRKINDWLGDPLAEVSDDPEFVRWAQDSQVMRYLADVIAKGL